MNKLHVYKQKIYEAFVYPNFMNISLRLGQPLKPVQSVVMHSFYYFTSI